MPHLAMKEHPSKDALPDEVAYVFDKSNALASRTILISSYETHKARTGIMKEEEIEGSRIKSQNTIVMET